MDFLHFLAGYGNYITIIIAILIGVLLEKKRPDQKNYQFHNTRLSHAYSVGSITGRNLVDFHKSCLGSLSPRRSRHRRSGVVHHAIVHSDNTPC
jgi:hypothetical protein